MHTYSLHSKTNQKNYSGNKEFKKKRNEPPPSCKSTKKWRVELLNSDKRVLHRSILRGKNKKKWRFEILDLKPWWYRPVLHVGLQCVAVRCIVLQCVVLCCSVLQCVAMCVAACCSILHIGSTVNMMAWEF